MLTPISDALPRTRPDLDTRGTARAAAPRIRHGVTNLVARATTAADELTREELLEGARILTRKVRRLAPRYLAIVCIGAYRTAFERPRAKLGAQRELPSRGTVELFAALRTAAAART